MSAMAKTLQISNRWKRAVTAVFQRFSLPVLKGSSCNLVGKRAFGARSLSKCFFLASSTSRADAHTRTARLVQARCLEWGRSNA